MKTTYFTTLILSVLVLFSCGGDSSTTESEDNGKLKIVATTTIIADWTQNIVGDEVEVVSLMGVGIDPHMYKPTPSDLTLLQEADVIFYHGLHLEGKMVDIFEKFETEGKAFAVTNPIDKSRLMDLGDENYDPHTWFDVMLSHECIKYIGSEMSKIDAVNSENYQGNMTAYFVEIEALHQYITTQIESIPVEKRILISTHDAFEYYGAQYGIETHGIQGVSTATEAGIQDITATVDLVVTNKIPMIFSEQSASSQTVESVVKGAAEKDWKVTLAKPLFTDALGNAEDNADTYIKMMRANTDNLVNSLK